MADRQFVILFAGVPGSSKSIIAYHLSQNFNLPIFSTDNLRFEVQEDMRVNNITIPHALEEYERRRDRRWADMLARNNSFILDASIDRRWEATRDDLQKAGYGCCVINMGLSKDFIAALYKDTGRDSALDDLDAYQKQHDEFVQQYYGEITGSITDETFPHRLDESVRIVKKFLSV